MTLSLTKSIRETFHLSALRLEAKSLLTGRHWNQYHRLTERCKKLQEKEVKNFNNPERFKQRVDQAYRKLLKERTAKTKEYKPGYAQEDLFDRNALLKLADSRVRKSHEQRLARIERIETKGIERLLHSSARENQHTGQSKDAFTRAVERRSGKDRRQQSGKGQFNHKPRQSMH